MISKVRILAGLVKYFLRQTTSNVSIAKKIVNIVTRRRYLRRLGGKW